MSSLRCARETEPNGSSTSSPPSKSFSTKSCSPARSMMPVKFRRPSTGSEVRTFASCPTKRRKCSGFVSGRSMPGEETSKEPSYPSASSAGETAETTREQNSWSTGPSSRSTSNVSRGPAENCASTSSLPSGSEPSTTCANLSSLAVSHSPSFDVKKSNGSEDPLLSSSKPDYIAEYVGYKARRSAAIRATPQRRVRCAVQACLPIILPAPRGLLGSLAGEQGKRGATPSTRSPEIKMCRSADAKVSAACYEFKVSVGSIGY